MKTIVFNQGFNRIEHHQIVCLERAKLNRLLDSMRRLTQILIDSARREIKARPQFLPSLEMIWNKLENHDSMRQIRRRIDYLTDAYPQFLQQVSEARTRLREKAIAVLEAARFAAQKAVCVNRSAPSGIVSLSMICSKDHT